MPSTSGTPPISAARMQAESAAESATDMDCSPDPKKRQRTVCNMQQRPMENRAAASSEEDRCSSNPAARAMETGMAMPSDRISSICCREEKNSGAAGGTWPLEYSTVFFAFSFLMFSAMEIFLSIPDAIILESGIHLVKPGSRGKTCFAKGNFSRFELTRAAQILYTVL